MATFLADVAHSHQTYNAMTGSENIFAAEQAQLNCAATPREHNGRAGSYG